MKKSFFIENMYSQLQDYVYNNYILINEADLRKLIIVFTENSQKLGMLPPARQCRLTGELRYTWEMDN